MDEDACSDRRDWVVEVGGIRVGFLSIATAETMFLSHLSESLSFWMHTEATCACTSLPCFARAGM